MSDVDLMFAKLVDMVEQQGRVITRLQTRINNLIREGEVKSVDYEKGEAIVDAHGVETKPTSWAEQAGDIVEWNPLTEGQRVTVLSPGGDIGKAIIMPGGYTDAVQQPHNQGAQKRVKIGDCVITQSAGGLLISVGGTTFEFTAAGFKQTGGSVKHNEKDIGDTHRHGGVITGPGNTDVPI